MFLVIHVKNFDKHILFYFFVMIIECLFHESVQSWKDKYARFLLILHRKSQIIIQCFNNVCRKMPS